MTVAGLVGRFALIYIALLIALAIGTSLLGLKPNSGINAGALLGAAMGACLWFANKNQRYLSAAEKRTAVLCMWAVDMALQVVIGLGAMAASGVKLTLGPILIGIAVIALLHGIGLYFIVGIAGKQYAKLSKRAA